MTNPESKPQQDGAQRGHDDRRGDVDPARNPAPSSPDRDEEAVAKGEEILERVKAY
jgi:hypothetical protein